MIEVETDILVVGGGAAGMSAALAASSYSGATVTLVDNNAKLGGQIWRDELGQSKSAEARSFIKAIETKRIRIFNDAQVFAAPTNTSVLAETSRGTARFEYNKLILATGARERFLPFPGWTLPGVFGAGGLQALVKGGFDVAGKRIVVAGSGPLLLVVAEYLKSKGAKVIAVAEQAPASRINRFAIGLWRSPAKLAQALWLRMKLFGVSYLTDTWVTDVRSLGSGRSNGPIIVTFNRHGKKWQVEGDYLACGFDLVPNNELASLIGCKIENSFVSVDEFQRTTCENVFCAGEPTGIGGVAASLVEGTIAGLCSVDATDAARMSFATRDRSQRFAAQLTRTFALRDELRSLANDNTIVCRCEDVDFGRLREFDSWRAAKLQTRCGMGPCQGRICGAAAQFLFDWKIGPARPPIFPIKLENL